MKVTIGMHPQTTRSNKNYKKVPKKDPIYERWWGWPELNRRPLPGYSAWLLLRVSS